MNKKPGFIFYISVLLALGIAFLCFIGILLYGYNINNKLTQQTIRVLPFPAIIINYTHFITLNNVLADLNSVQRFYENQDFSSLGFRVDFKTSDGQKRLQIKEKGILNKQIEYFTIETLAKKRGILITDEQVSQEVERKLVELGNRNEVEANLEKLYGWNIATFKEKIVKPEMYKEKLAESFLNEDDKLEKASKKIDAAATDLNQGSKFEDVVTKYSEGESAKNAGELGWFSADQMLPEIASVAFQIEKSKSSDIIQSGLGFHIIQVQDKKVENEIPMVKVRQIFVKTPSFGDWLADNEKDLKIIVPLKSYTWNQENQMLEFTDPDLKNFEDNLLENSPGDISVIF